MQGGVGGVTDFDNDILKTNTAYHRTPTPKYLITVIQKIVEIVVKEGVRIQENY